MKKKPPRPLGPFDLEQHGRLWVVRRKAIWIGVYFTEAAGKSAMLMAHSSEVDTANRRLVGK